MLRVLEIVFVRFYSARVIINDSLSNFVPEMQRRRSAGVSQSDRLNPIFPTSRNTRDDLGVSSANFNITGGIRINQINRGIKSRVQIQR